MRFLVILSTAILCAHAADLGIFEQSTEIGNPKHRGSAKYDPGTKQYEIAGGGANMWFTNDALHYAWTRVSGDVALAADVSFVGAGGDPHRKACLIIRQDLDPDSAYADAALHGEGLTSLQYREAKGALTREIQANASGPRRLRIEKRGKYVSMSIAGEGTALQPAGGSFRLELKEPFYIGLGVCAHNNEQIETALFRNVELRQLPAPLTNARVMSTLETVPIGSKDRRVVFWTTNLIEAPNWSRDGKLLIFNTGGKLYSIPPTGGVARAIDTGFASRNNNDHGISPDGTLLAISDQSQGDRKSRIHTVPFSGGTPKRVTELGPSYWHGWSPDGKTLAYCAERNGEFDVYTIPVGGGQETRLTNAKGLDDGPEYSPDGQYIYFNSDRTARMQIWRMKPDGSGQEQITNDESNNWFAHPSPDGKYLVFLSFDASVQGHPANKDVMLRLMSLADRKTEVLAKLFGGQGTMNVPSWSPDSKRVAFVSYQYAISD